MAPIIRKSAACLCLCLILCFSFCFCAHSQRPVKPDRIRDIAKHNLIESAERWLDVRELTGRNDHPMITEAMKLCGLPGNAGYAWCAAAQAEIHDYAGLSAPNSARVVDWFAQHVVWTKKFGEIPSTFDVRGMVGALYYRNLGRYGHIVLIIGQDKHNYYCYEGNTNIAGSREGDGFYRTIRTKESIAALADYCLNGQLFNDTYNEFLKLNLK